MAHRPRPIAPPTRTLIGRVFARLDYGALGPVYCDEGGAAFWRAKRGPCRALGMRLAAVLLGRLRRGGRSLYVGAGVAELPAALAETLDLRREVAAFNLRRTEVAVINRALADRGGPAWRLRAGDARRAAGPFDHLWMVSVLNDPERFPTLSALSYGRADPVTFDPRAFARERAAVRALADACLNKLATPALVTTSVEEIPWITDWAARSGRICFVEPEDHPTAMVEDPVCFIRIEDRGPRRRPSARRAALRR
jgi:hypothetical protein